MLLNEFLKAHRKIEEQSGRQQKVEATVAQQQDEITALTAALKAQAAQIQKVSDDQIQCKQGGAARGSQLSVNAGESNQRSSRNQPSRPARGGGVLFRCRDLLCTLQVYPRQA